MGSELSNLMDGNVFVWYGLEHGLTGLRLGTIFGLVSYSSRYLQRVIAMYTWYVCPFGAVSFLFFRLTRIVTHAFVLSSKLGDLRCHR